MIEFDSSVCFGIPSERHPIIFLIHFSERKKLIRQARRCRAEIVNVLSRNSSATADDDQIETEQELREKLKKLQADLEYVDNYPQNKPYIALFPNSSGTSLAVVHVEVLLYVR